MENNVIIPLYLAPMDDISDYPFRLICKENNVDFMYTDFISSESLIRNVNKSLKKIQIKDQERPIGIQIFGENVESMQKAAMLVEKYNPEEININCGCPAKKIVEKGAGAALLKNPEYLISLVKSIVDITNIPISVKMRLGWDEKTIFIEEIIKDLQKIGVKKVIVHARTRSQMYSGKTQLDYLRKIKQNKNITIPIIGNGDVVDIKSALEMQKTGVDGIMIGRGAIGNPWIFNDLKNGEIKKRTLNETINVIKKHLNLALEIYDEENALSSLKKHYIGYFKYVKYSKKIRTALMDCKTKEELLQKLENVSKNYQ